MTIGRRDIDDAAALLCGHHAQLMLETEQGAEHIGVEGGGVVLNGLIDDRPGLSLRAGVVDGRIEAPESGHGLVNQMPDFFLVPYIGLYENGLGTELL